MRVCCVHHHTSENQCTYTHLLIYVYFRMIKPYLHIQLPCKHTWKGLSTDTEHWKPFTVAFDDELHKRTLVVRVHLLRVCVSTDVEKNRHHNQHRTGQRVSVRDFDCLGRNKGVFGQTWSSGQDAYRRTADKIVQFSAQLLHAVTVHKPQDVTCPQPGKSSRRSWHHLQIEHLGPDKGPALYPTLTQTTASERHTRRDAASF